jgi:hypothetical protein
MTSTWQGIWARTVYQSSAVEKSSLTGRKERVGPRTVIGGVDDSDDLG